MFKRTVLLVSLLVGATNAFAQGTPGTLRCAFTGNPFLDVHYTRDPSSSVIATVRCGDPLLVFDLRFGSPHIRTEQGIDGYILGLTIGQWVIETEIEPVVPLPVVLPQSAGASHQHDNAGGLRRFNITWLGGYERQGGVDLASTSLEFAVNITPRIAIVAELAPSQTVDPPTRTVTSYRFGPRWYFANTPRVTAFIHGLAGGGRLDFDPFGTNLSANGASFAAGGGMDLKIRPWVAWRAFQVDGTAVRFHGNTDGGFRLATGFEFRIKPELQ